MARTVKATAAQDKKEKGFLKRILATDGADMPAGKTDKLFVLLVILLLFAGSVMVFSASRAYADTHFGDKNYFVRLQLLFAVFGITAMYITSRIPLSFYKKIAFPGYIVTTVLLLLVLLIGTSAGGAKRWLSLGPFSFQPSEVAKTILILTLSRYFSEHHTEVLTYSDRGRAFRYGILFPCLILLPYCGLIMLQKHLSCIIILGCLTVIMMFAAGSDIRRIAVFSVPAIAGVGAFAWFTEYTRRRILIWFNPEKFPTDGGWQTLQGLMAIGSGGFFGLGLGNSRLKYSYVSEPQNDFIFTIVCEELGFIGAFLIILLFFLFVMRGIKIGLNNTDAFARLTAVGLVSKVGVQVLLNLGVITNLLPNTGISLPFFSYGGSSLVMLMAEMGIVLSVSRTSLYRR